MTEDELKALEQNVFALAPFIDSDPSRVVGEMPTLVHNAIGQAPLIFATTREAVAVLQSAGVLIDAAVRGRNVDSLWLAEAWLTDVLAFDKLEDLPDAISDALYFRGNARVAIADQHTDNRMTVAPREQWPLEEWPLERAVARWEMRDLLRAGRSDLRWGARLAGDGARRGGGLCNLANTLDHSGRWIEAYDAYVGALAADSTNGNAAGNAAVLIERVIGAGWDFEGHLCSLYDHYLTMAKTNRDGTVRVAGERAAERFDAMKLLGSHAPLRFDPEQQDPDLDDPYQRWVVDNRLALVAGLEGVGAGEVEGRWDTITLRQVSSSDPAADMPAIVSMLNVLKADYLVARRLGYEAWKALDEGGGWRQDDSDPGVYVETLQYAVVGELSSKLVLAHRAALDVLDKTAVSVNEHFAIGDRPDKTNFRHFWFEPNKKAQTTEDKQRTLRESLLAVPTLATGVLSMAELAYDMGNGGVYAEAQAVRNAGTHRFVLVHHGYKDVQSTDSMHAMELQEMVETTLESLAVARAAYTYLVAMVSAYEARTMTGSGTLLTLPMMNTL